MRYFLTYSSCFESLGIMQISSKYFHTDAGLSPVKTPITPI
jgi:hypothetical protein